MARYRIIAGKHRDVNGTLYQPGGENEVIETEADMEAMFVNQWERVWERGEDNRSSRSRVEDDPVVPSNTQRNTKRQTAPRPVRKVTRG